MGGKIRRSRMEVIIDVLAAVQEGANKTGVVSRTKLNFKVVDRYLKGLQKEELVENREERYFITGKGKTLLEKARRIATELKSGNRSRQY